MQHPEACDFAPRSETCGACRGREQEPCRFSGRGTDPDEVEIGMPVEMVTRRIQERGPQGQGYLVYGYELRPVLPAVTQRRASGNTLS